MAYAQRHLSCAGRYDYFMLIYLYMKNYINYKTFFILLSLSLLSVICVFPYIISVRGETLKQIGQPIWVIFVAQFIQSLILFSIAIFFGLFFTKKINFHLPLIEAFIEKRNYKETLKNILGKSILTGAVTAVIIYVSDILFTMQGAVISTHRAMRLSGRNFSRPFMGASRRRY